MPMPMFLKRRRTKMPPKGKREASKLYIVIFNKHQKSCHTQNYTSSTALLVVPEWRTEL